ncbi:sulfotransferase [Bacillus sp. JCM 19034]|uniref:sulfotransferase family protein n=1 Tax=Bacillus sp. JCM 19034 TaxID=1481928 RepID=UPI00078425B6|nr:sulfotransferase [Bacillus sp. JCM 19034]
MTSSITSHPFPSYLIIGAQKCGTTSLYHYLIQHPQINPTKTRREIHFFDTKFYGKGIEWYKNQFIHSPNMITGEATPRYLYNAIVPERVYKHFPNIKLIILLRNPVERAFSQYKMEFEKEKKRLRYNDTEKYSFDSIIEAGLHNHNNRWIDYLERGIYSKQIKRWLKYYPIEQFHIIKSEQFFRNPKSSYKRVLRFLDIEEFQLNDYKRYQKSQTAINMNPNTKRKLQAFYEPYNKELNELLGRKFDW